MAPPPPRNVQMVLSEALHNLIQTRLQSEVDNQGTPHALDPDTLRTLRVLQTRAHYVGRKNRVCYFAVLVKWSDGHRSVARWRVPADQQPKKGAGLRYPHAWDKRLTGGRYPSILSGARAGTGRFLGESRQSRSRTRPEIGRAFKRSGR